MKRIKLILTEKCNWKCEYCFREEYEKSKESTKNINELIYKYVPELAKITNDLFFTGGELGLLDDDILDFLFNQFKHCIIRIATNGAWFKTSSYEKYKNNNISILYHCAPSLKDNIEFLSVPKSKYTFVITDNNYLDVKEFLYRYKNITFFPLIDLRKKRDISKEIHRNIYESIKDANNIPNQIKEASKIMSGDSEEWMAECLKKKPLRIAINFPKNKISSCCILTEGIPITSENINLVNNDLIKLPVDDRVCNFCVVRYLNDSTELIKG